MSVGMVVLVFVVWCALSVPIGILAGKWIAGPRGPR
jgi:hypothetical protein